MAFISNEEINEIIGFEGDLVEGELEIGQIAGLIHDILPVETIINNVISEFEIAKKEMSQLTF